jgi:hypothetical protein
MQLKLIHALEKILLICDWKANNTHDWILF